MRSLECILTQYNWCPMKKENLDIEIDTHRGKMMRGRRQRLELCCHEPRKVWGYRKLEEARKHPPLEVSEGAQPTHILVLDFWPLEPRDNKLLLF